MKVTVNLNDKPAPAEMVFAQHQDLAFVEKWREKLGADPNSDRKDAVEFAELAKRQYVVESVIGQPYIKSVEELREHIAQDPHCEVAGFALLKCDWYPHSEVIGMCHFRRTWCNNIVLDYLASHPFTIAPKGEPPKDPQYIVTRVGTALLVFLSHVAARYACGKIWGEATKSSSGYYKYVLKLESVQDLFLIPPQNFMDANTMKPDALEAIYKVEETNPPLVGKRSAMVGPKRQLVNHFLDLPRHVQDEVAQALGLHKEDDNDILEDEWCRVLFQRADQNGKLRELWDEVEKRHQFGEPEKNPFVR